jgi:hypothetical protein
LKSKTFMKYSLVFFILCFILFLFTGCDSKSEEEKLKEKALSQIEFLDIKLTNILNGLNNIKSENNDLRDKNNNVKLEANIDWNIVREEIKIIYYSWNTIILDLYSLNIESEDILAFSSFLDVLTGYVNKEDRINSLLSATQLYRYLPVYLETISKDSAKKIVFTTKSYLFNGYSLVEQEKWNDIKIELEKAEQSFMPLTTDIEFINMKSYRINKTFVALKELKSSINRQDKQIFYIKYNNLLKELNEL